MKLVYIEWADSFGCSANWQSLEFDPPNLHICKSVGWLAHDGKDCKVIVPHLSEGANQGCGDMTIPARSIVRMKTLHNPAPKPATHS